MKILLVITTILAVIISWSVVKESEINAATIPKWYYDSPCQQPNGVSLYNWLENLQLPPYEIYKFDCSQRAAYVEWLAESCGVNTVFVAEEFDGYAHMWLMIDGYAYETGEHNRWVAPGDWHYAPDDTWESLYELPYIDEEFGWWLTYPQLRIE